MIVIMRDAVMPECCNTCVCSKGYGCGITGTEMTTKEMEERPDWCPLEEVEPCEDAISRQAAIDALDEQIEQCNKALGSFDISLKDEFAIKVERASLKAYREQLENLPPVQPKGTKLSTVCLLCKKPAVTFNTEDDIPYTNYSYCEDCLRKGLKLLKAQNKMLPPVQPEIIRCKDCKRFKEPSVIVDADWGWCSGWHMSPTVTFVKVDGFCHRAEKRGEAE